MADEYFIQEMLTEAHKQKLLNGKQNPILIETVNHANLIIIFLKNEEGLSTEQIAHRVGFHVNTVRIFLRVLKSLKVVESFRQQGNGQINYWRILI